MFICITVLELPCITVSGNPTIMPEALFGTKPPEFPCIMPAGFPGMTGTMPGCWPRTNIWDIPPITGWPVKKPTGWGGVVTRPSNKSTLLTVCLELVTVDVADTAPTSPAADLQQQMSSTSHWYDKRCESASKLTKDVSLLPRIVWAWGDPKLLVLHVYLFILSEPQWYNKLTDTSCYIQRCFVSNISRTLEFSEVTKFSGTCDSRNETTELYWTIFAA